MVFPSKAFDKKVYLTDRSLIRVSGEDAAEFLQNIMTNDIRQVDENGIVYSCLLTPQGQFLHDFFIVKNEENYLVDCDDNRIDDLIRRMGIFKLRAKVLTEKLAEGEGAVYTGSGLADPRHKLLGYRHYVLKPSDTATDAALTDYTDFCIALGVPSSHALLQSRDVLADVNLDLLNAVAWDKGCFIGQEVTARMRYKALAKKRLIIFTGEGLTAEAPLLKNGHEIGQLREVNTAGDMGLAVAKLAALDKADALITCSERKVFWRKPGYIVNH